MAFARAPYNFIPFPKKFYYIKDFIELKNDKPELKYKHNLIDDRLNSGYINYEIIARTPLYVSNGEDDFYNINGKYCIPGSTIRGKVRSNCEILSNSYPVFVKDTYFSYREVGTSKSSINNEYTKHIKVTRNSKINRLIRVGEISNNKGEFLIRPYKKVDSKDGFFKIIKDKDIKNSSVLRIHSLYNSGYEPYVEYINCGNIEKMRDVVISNVSESDYILMNSNKFGKYDSGNSKEKNSDKKCHYVIKNEYDEEQSLIKLKSSIINEYISRKETISNPEHLSEYYELPKDGESKPIFYLLEDNKVNSIGFTPYLRLKYDKSVCNGIKTRKKGIDMADSIFGYTCKEGYAYKGRVKFEHAYLSDKYSSDDYEATLLNPKPTSIQLYLIQDEKEKLNHYNSDFELCGRKFYWLKDGISSNIGVNNKAVKTTLKPVPENSIFEGKVIFENLSDYELGLLILSLKPKDPSKDIDFYDSLGQGKPYGFGRYTIEIKEIEKKNTDKIYRNFFEVKEVDRYINISESIEKYIDTYIDYYNDNISNENFYLNSPIRSFFHSKSYIVKHDDEKYNYMDVDEFKKRDILENIIEHTDKNYTKIDVEEIEKRKFEKETLGLSSVEKEIYKFEKINCPVMKENYFNNEILPMVRTESVLKDQLYLAKVSKEYLVSLGKWLKEGETKKLNPKNMKKMKELKEILEKENL